MAQMQPLWELRGLPAEGPDPALRERLMDFGQLVGDWVIVDHRFPMTDAGHERRVGEVHFNWILGGRAVQDVWGPRDPKTGAFEPVGTTLRLYDTTIKAWRTTWISPVQLEVRTFIGRMVGNEIVMKERNRAASIAEHWIYSDLRPRSFRWRAERRSPIGGRWETVEEMIVERISGPTSPPLAAAAPRPR